MFRASGRLKDLRRNCAGNSTGLSTCRPNGLLPRRFVPSGLCSRSADRIGAFASERPCSGRACSGEPCSIRFDLRQGSVRRIPHPGGFCAGRLVDSVPQECVARPALLCAAPRTALDLRAAIAFGRERIVRRTAYALDERSLAPAFCAQRALFAI